MGLPVHRYTQTTPVTAQHHKDRTRSPTATNVYVTKTLHHDPIWMVHQIVTVIVHHLPKCISSMV